MLVYILLSRFSSQGQRQVIAEPEKLKHIRGVLEQWEATIKADYHLLGESDHCTVFEVSDNFSAQRAVLNQELTDTETSLLIPAIDLDLFEKLVRQEIRTDGPHEWQIYWWARLARLTFRWYQYDRWVWRYFKPFNVTGKNNFSTVKGPCIVVANHTSHFDTLALLGALPNRVRSNIYIGAAVDRWFLQKAGGRKEVSLQPWYNFNDRRKFPDSLRWRFCNTGLLQMALG